MLMVQLDYSAAFDTIDHMKLLNKLDGVGVEGEAKAWFQRYLSGQTQCVKINDQFSKSVPLNCGVPQGSVLGPVLFSIYVRELGSLIQSMGLSYSVYADDTQLYSPCAVSETSNKVAVIELCVERIRGWSTANQMKLNDKKTVCAVFGAPHAVKKLPLLHSKVGCTCIEFGKSAKSLGVIFDQQLKMNQNVSATCKSASYSLRILGKLRSSLDKPIAESLIHAFISSRLDYANSLLAGCDKKTISRLQRIQNSAARIICGLRKHDHITAALKELHWLPVAQRVDFKIAVLTFRATQGRGPSYLTELLASYVPQTQLRSSCKRLLVIPKTSLKLGDMAFSKYAATVWNGLPDKIRLEDNFNSFLSLLKTHLFKCAFDV
jgi:hypothetical protein